MAASCYLGFLLDKRGSEQGSIYTKKDAIPYWGFASFLAFRQLFTFIRNC